MIQIRSLSRKPVDKCRQFSNSIDQLPASEYFHNGVGLELSDVNVFMRLSDSPEFREKLQKYLVENEVTGFDPSVSDDEVLSHLESKYLTRQQILSDIGDRISVLRSADAQKELEKQSEHKE